MPKWTTDVGDQITSSLLLDEPSNSCWLGTADGRIVTVRVLGLAVSVRGTGWSDLVAACPSTDGNGIVVVTRTAVWLAPLGNATPDAAEQLAALADDALAAARTVGGVLLVLDSAGVVSTVPTEAGGQGETLVAFVDGATSLAVDDARGTLHVATTEAGGTHVETFDLATGQDLGVPVDLAVELVSIGGPPAVTARAGVLGADATGVVGVHPLDGSSDPERHPVPGATAVAHWHSLVFAAAGSELRLAEWGLAPAVLPVTVGLDPLARGGWAGIAVDYAAAGLDPAAVAWEVREGPDMGTLSLAVGAGPGGTAVEHRVLAGGTAGEFHVDARDANSGDVLATARFRVVDRWPDTVLGPSRAVTGFQRVFAKSGWGGGPGGPQNIRATPAPEEFRVAVILVRAKGSTSGMDGDARRDQFTEHLIGTKSVREYYEEVSFRSASGTPGPAHPKGTTVTLANGAAFGPIDVPHTWTDLFTMGNAANPWGSWNPTGPAWELLGARFSEHVSSLGLIETVLRSIDSVVFAVMPASDDPVKVGEDTLSAQWTWAFAGAAPLYWKSPYSTTFKTIPAVVMPAALPANHPDPWPEEWYMTTICHELGHNLGCPDLYGTFPAEIADRDLDNWDLMASDAPLPHFSLPHRMRLGWIDPGWVESIDFGANPASRTVTLRAIEALSRSGPPAGERAGVEVRVSDGWNYYFEYRREQAAQVGDQNLVVNRALLGTDVHQALADEMDRPLIMKLPKDIDGDGPVLNTPGTDYEESDVTNPERMHDFRIIRENAAAADPNRLQVKVEWVSAHRAELRITPAPGRGNYKSPDIDIDGPAGLNKIAKGLKHTIRARVTNAGTKAADKVHVRFSWLPFTTAPGTWNPLPDPPDQAIGPHTSATFAVEWTPPGSLQIDGKEVEHFCIKVDIDRYVDPTDPSGSEIVIHNNWAQSNFDTGRVAHGSPSERLTTAVTATNKLADPALHATILDQSNPHFRAYVDHAWQRIDPSATVVWQLAHESLAGDPIFGDDFEAEFARGGETMLNEVAARCLVQPARPNDGPFERFGVQLNVRPGIRTWVDDLQARGELVTGRVLFGDPARPTGVGDGTVRAVGWSEEAPDEQYWADGDVDPDGAFRIGLDGRLVGAAFSGRVWLVALYLGTLRYAPSRSGEFPLESG